MRTKKRSVAERIYADLRANREKDGAAIIEAKDVAKLIRARLRDEFPDQRFSVRSKYSAVRVSWQDGPCEKTVAPVVNCYSFGGFDGMIDMAYDSQNWLLPNGVMEPAFSVGTEGSHGTVPAYTSDCPEPGAIMVKYGPRYIFTSRTVSEGLLLQLVEAASKHYGFDYDAEKPLHDQRAERQGEWITTLGYRWEQETQTPAVA